MKKIYLISAFVSLLTPPVFSQLKYDNIWTIGYGQIWQGPNGYSLGGVIMDFSTTPPSFLLQEYLFDRPRATISDKNGKLVAYTNGCRIVNRNHEGMLFGDTLSPGVVYDEFCTDGSLSDYPLWQPCIFLPKPGSDSLYFLFHIRDDDYLWNAMHLMYSVIDASAAGGDGAVISKNNVVLSDSAFLAGYVTATRHANGRDWWIVVPRRFSNNKHVALLTPNGVEYMGMQNFDTTGLKINYNYCCAQKAFSADGSKYFDNTNERLIIFDFDKCTGELSNPVRLGWDSLPSGGGGVATSPNSRYLYLSSGGTIQQYDLQAPDLAASMEVVAEYDGFMAPFPTNFFQMMPGPDGKIYIVCSYDNNIIHVIHNPNARGKACRVEQHAYTLPALTSYLTPNFANYNLGPIDGSACDTLGINNLPIARFQWYAEDTLSPQYISFTDYSYHAPDTWHWDFGDGSSSQDTSPVHLYNAPGVYTVCLSVCNDFACDTLCKNVEIKSVNTLTMETNAIEVSLWPNPVGETLHLRTDKPIKQIGIMDATGKMLVSQAWPGSELEARIDVRRLPSGLYCFYLNVDGRLWNGRFVKR